MARAFNAHFEFGETHKKLLIKYPPDNNVEDTTNTPSNIFQLNTLIKSYKMSIIIVRRGDMSITATELKNNLGKYLLLSAKEDVFITKNGKVVAKLTNPHQDRVEVAKSLFGILPKDADLNEAKEERLGAK